jgi:hypothetical protein
MLGRLSIVGLGLLCCVPVAFADEADVKKAAKSQANEIQSALVKGEFGKVADRTHPKAVEALGGKEKMVVFLTEGIKEMKKAGIEFKATKMLDPSDPVKVGKELYILVPFTLELTISGKRFQSKGALVGVSSDGGKMWVFLDATPGRDKLKDLLPDLPDSLMIPKPEMPTPVKD